MQLERLSSLCLLRSPSPKRQSAHSFVDGALFVPQLDNQRRGENPATDQQR
jgi:hypothetical protein